MINEYAFEFLDAPVKRVASKDVPIAYSTTLEDQILVQTDWILDKINEGGWESLTKQEEEYLNLASKKLFDDRPPN